MSSIATEAEIHYPDSDGQPLGETDWHITSTLGLLAGLRCHFAGRDDVYVASDMFLYYQEGQPSKRRAPDCMVIFGVENRMRRVFKTWQEGAVPSVIFEVSSDETYREDLVEKARLYAELGVAEYYLFDPLGDLLDVPLLGYRLVGSSYEAIPSGRDGSQVSPLLGLRLVPEGHMIRLVDLRTGRLIPFFVQEDDLNRRLAQDLAEKDEELADKREKLAEKAEELADKREKLAEKDEELADKREKLAEKDEELAEKAEVNRRLSEELDRLRALIADRGPGPAHNPGPGA